MPSVVVGKRRSFWKGMSRTELVWVFVASPVCALLAIRWFIGLRLVDSPLGDNFGGTFWGGLLSIVGLAIAGFGVWLFISAVRTPVIASACPVCGIERVRGFFERPPPTTELAKLSKTARRRALHKAEDEGAPTPCGACIAYLRIHLDTLEVREQSIVAIGEHTTPYGVRPVQYVSVVKRGDDADHTFQFQFPAMCAVCGSPDAPLRRKVSDRFPRDARGGVVDTLLWRSSHNAPLDHKKTPSEELDDGLRGLETPVCANHTQTVYDSDAVTFDNGSLNFAGYRYYKEFCALNRIIKGEDATSSRP
jgi:hypothetical protein